MAVSVTGGGLSFDATIENTQFKRQLDAIERDLNRMAATAEKRGAELDSIFKKAAASAAGFFSIQQATNFVNQLIEVRGQFEQLEVAYSTILKSKRRGDELFQETVQLAATTPFNLTEVAQSTKQLLAYGIAAKDVTGTLRMLGDVAAGVSAPIGDIAYLYGTLKTQGRAYMMDIRQFTGRGIPIIAELAKQLKVSEAEVNKLVEAGKVGFPEVEKAFKALTGQGGIFFNLMQAQSQTLTGRLSNLQDAFAQMLNEIGRSNQGILSSGIVGLANLVENYQRVLDIIQLLIVAYGTYKAVVIATTAVQALQAAGVAALTVREMLHYGALLLVDKAQKALNSSAVVGAAQTAALTAVITALISVVYGLTADMNALSKAQGLLNEISQEGTKSVQTQIDKLESLQRVITDVNRSEDIRLKAVRNLRDIMQERLKQYSDEEILAGKAKDAITRYTDEIIRSGKIIAAQKKLQELQGELFNTDANAQIGNSELERIDAAYANIPTRERLNLSLTNFFKSNKSKFTGFDAGKDLVVQQYRTLIQQQVNAIVNEYGKGIDELNSNVDDINNQPEAKKNTADYFKKIIEDNQTALNGLDKFSKEFKAKSAIYKKNILDAKENLKAFDASGDAKAMKSQNTQLEKFASMMGKIQSINDRYNQKAMTDDQAKLQTIRDDFKGLKKEIDDYNRDSENKIKIPDAVLKNIGKSEDNALDNQTERNKTAAIEKEIAKQKQLYTEYESYKEKLGQEAADKEYATLLQSGKNYQEYIEKLQTAIPQGVLSGPLQERKDLLAKEQTEALAANKQYFTELLATTLTYEQERNAIISKYLLQAQALRDKAALTSDEKLKAQYLSQATQAVQNGKEELDALDDANIQKLDAYKALFTGIDELSTDSAKTVIANAQQMLDAAVKEGRISKELAAQIKKALLDAGIKIDSRLAAQLRNVASGLSKVANEAGAFDEVLGKALSTLANITNAVADIKDNINQLQTGKLDFLGKIGSGLGIFGAAFGIVNSIASLFDNSAKIEAQNQYRGDLQLKQLEAINKALQRQLDISKELYGTERLAAYQKDLKDIERTQNETAQKLAGKVLLTGDAAVDEWIKKYNRGDKIKEPAIPDSSFFKFKDTTRGAPNLADLSLPELLNLADQGKLDEQTTAIINNMVELEEQYTATRNAINEEITGLTLDTLIGDIRSLLDNGEFNFDNIEDSLTKAIRAGIINGFQRQYVEKAMQGFYDLLAKAGEDGVYTDDEIASLKAERERIAKYLEAQSEQLDGLLDEFNAGDAQDRSLSGAIKGITEEQAGVLEGTFRGVQQNTFFMFQELMRQSKMMAEFQQQVMYDNLRKMTYLENIERNTKRTGDNTDGIRDILKSIDKNTGNTTSAILRASGLTDL